VRGLFLCFDFEIEGELTIAILAMADSPV